jgi:hypothetical protein
MPCSELRAPWYMPVVSGPPATTFAAALAGPSSTTAACRGPATSGRATSVASASGTVGTCAELSVASLGTMAPAGSSETLASSHGALTPDCSNSIRARPSTGTRAPPTSLVPLASAGFVSVWATSATKKRGYPACSGR